MNGKFFTVHSPCGTILKNITAIALVQTYTSNRVRVCLHTDTKMLLQRSSHMEMETIIFLQKHRPIFSLNVFQINTLLLLSLPLFYCMVLQVSVYIASYFLYVQERESFYVVLHKIAKEMLWFCGMLRLKTLLL